MRAVQVWMGFIDRAICLGIVDPVRVGQTMIFSVVQLCI